jgi:hypothetical protein
MGLFNSLNQKKGKENALKYLLRKISKLEKKISNPSSNENAETGDYNFSTNVNPSTPDVNIQRVSPKVGLPLYNQSGTLTGAICLEYDAGKIGSAHIELLELDRDGSVTVGMAHNKYTLDLQGAAPSIVAMRGSKILIQGWRPKDVRIFYEPNGNFDGTIRVYIGELNDVHQPPSRVYIEKILALVSGSEETLQPSDFNLYLEDTAFQGTEVLLDITKVTQSY